MSAEQTRPVSFPAVCTRCFICNTTRGGKEKYRVRKKRGGKGRILTYVTVTRQQALFRCQAEDGVFLLQLTESKEA